MPWTQIDIDPARNQQVQSSYSESDGSITQQVTQTWVCIYAGIATPVMALSADDGNGNTIPTAGATYTISGNPWFICTQVVPRQIGPGQFEVQVTFSRKLAIQNGNKWDVTLAIDGEEFSQSAYTDMEGLDVVNSAGDSFDPGLTKTYYDEQIQIGYKTTTPPDFSHYRGYVNSDAVSFSISGIEKDYSARELLLKSAGISTTLTLGDTKNTPVWDVKMTLLAREDTYIDYVVDKGWKSVLGTGPAPGGGILKSTGEKRTASGAVTGKIDIKLQFGITTNDASRLDGTGQPLDPNAEPVYWGFKMQSETDFSDLFDGLS